MSNMQTSDQTLEDWKKYNVEIKIQNCELCGLENYCQHQGFCVECMTENHNMNVKIREKMIEKCAICGKKSIEGICSKCIRSMV